MAKLSAVNKNKKRIKLSDRLYKKRQTLKSYKKYKKRNKPKNETA